MDIARLRCKEPEAQPMSALKQLLHDLIGVGAGLLRPTVPRGFVELLCASNRDGGIFQREVQRINAPLVIPPQGLL